MVESECLAIARQLFHQKLRKAIDALTLKWCLAARWCAAPIKAALEFLVDDDIRGL